MLPAPRFHRLLAATLAALLLVGCASWRSKPQVQTLLPADVILLGEQHDVPAHQRLQAEMVLQLVVHDRLAALVLEMADAGLSTAALPPDAEEAQVRAALQWNEPGWPWAAYGPAIMTAVRAGVPVLGGNLPRILFSASMLDTALDRSLPPAAWAEQQQAIHDGHCGLLATTQLPAMTRIQVARDRSMAQTVQTVLRSPQVVLVLAGSRHVDRRLGVPQHLPAQLKVRSVRLQAGGKVEPSAAFDTVWVTAAGPDTDHCAALRQRLGR
jgi:uncharacterized iron-regulated protein